VADVTAAGGAGAADPGPADTGGRRADTDAGNGPSHPPEAPTAGAGTLSVLARRAHVGEADGASDASGRRRSGPGRRWTHRQRERWAVRAVVAGAAVAGALADVHPTGDRIADRMVTAAWVALVAAAASTARRWTWYLLAGVALAAAGDRVAVGCAVVALALALWSSRPVRPHPAVGAAVGGLGAFALLHATNPAGHGSSAAMTALAAAPVLVSGYRHAARRARRSTRRGIVAVAGGVVVVGAAYGASALGARADAERGMDRLELGLAAARDGDDAAAAAHLDAAGDAFAAAEGDLGGPLALPARMLPVVGQNAQAAESMAAAAADVARQGATAAAEADIDMLTVQGGRLDLAQVTALGGPLDDVAVALDGAADRLAGDDTGWLVPPVADRLDRVQAELAEARPDVDLAADATRLVPAMFGGDEPTRWLVAFVTPVEARGRTGFMGNFAELTAVEGDVEMTRFGRASELESGGIPGDERTLSGPEDYVARWARFDPAGTWRNVTMSPDFPSIGQVMAELYPQSGGRPVDGVIAVDPTGLAALLAFTGPISVLGVEDPLTAANAADYLLREQYLNPDNAGRIDALESFARQTFERLTTGDLPGPREVADTLTDVVADGHLHAYATDSEQQALFRDIGIDGALPAPGGGDSLAVVNNNAVGNKIDLYLHRTVDYSATWDPDTGEVEATATVTVRNDAPSSGLPAYVIGSPLEPESRPPSGTNRTYLSIYSPLALDGATVDGAPVMLEPQRELGRNVYSLFLDVPPDRATRTLELRLVGRVDPGDRYELTVANQPLVVPDDITVTVDAAGVRPGDVAAEAPLDVEAGVASRTESVTDEQATYVVEVDG
jgi:uncharacterized protein DUF4012